jgi:hypothetical protein
MQERKEIYEKALELISNGRYIWTCTAIGCQIKGVGTMPMKAEKFPEFMLFKPDNKLRNETCFSNQLEREICLDFCILFCDEKMFDNA